MRELSEQEIVRREKLKLVERPYPDKYETTHTIKEAREIENLHLLIKNNGHNFNLSNEELKLAGILI